MPCEVANPINIRRHEGHNLRLARELVFFFVLLLGLAPILRPLRVRVGGFSGGGSDVFSDEGLREEQGVELDFEANLDGGGREGPQLTGH